MDLNTWTLHTHGLKKENREVGGKEKNFSLLIHLLTKSDCALTGLASNAGDIAILDPACLVADVAGQSLHE